MSRLVKVQLAIAALAVVAAMLWAGWLTVWDLVHFGEVILASLGVLMIIVMWSERKKR